MRIMSKNCSCLFIWTLITLLLAACGNKSSTTITSTTAPSVFYSHSVAFKSVALYSWGANTYGQLGNADTTGATQLSPLPVSTTLTNVAGVSAGGTHTLAFTSGGAVYSWGNNGFGQLGNGSTIISFSPVQVQLTVAAGSYLLNVTSVAAGGSHSLALQSSGTVWAWGDNTYGQLGDASYTNRPTAVQAQDKGTGAPLTQVTKIAAGGGHSLAIAGLDPNSPAYAWGYNGFGQLGQQSSSTTNSSLALPVTQAAGAATLYNVTDIAAGGSHSLFLTSDGTVWACGYNALGQLGDGTTTDRKSGVVHLTGLTGVIQVAAGLDHSLALKSDKTVWAWGYNYSGQLGNGAALASVTGVSAPGQVKRFDGAFLTGVTKIVAIGNHSLAVDSSGQLWAWGDNTFGQLGNGTSTSSSLAIMVNNFKTANLISIP